jgi:hypothetical protein
MGDATLADYQALVGEVISGKKPILPQPLWGQDAAALAFLIDRLREENDLLYELARKWLHRATGLRYAIDTKLSSGPAGEIIQLSRQQHGPWDGPWGEDPESENLLLVPDSINGRKARGITT